MKDWERDKKWSDIFIPEIKQILGLHLIGEPDASEDQERNTDLIVLKLDAVRIACRVRTPEYLELYDYANEFTIRSGRPSGVKTELTKVIEGWGDYMFYGFSNKAEDRLAKWSLLDLKSFRISFMRMAMAGKVPKQVPNKDGSSHFIPFKIASFPDELVIATG